MAEGAERVAAEAEDNMNAKTSVAIFVVATGVAVAQAPRQQAVRQQSFDSPDAATQALITAAAKNDSATLSAILGSSKKGILTTGDAKQDQAERAEFARIANQKHQIEKSTVNGHVRILVIGDQQWPFPIPLLEQGQQWHFDAARGAVEMRARKIGEHELDAIEACAGYVAAQQAYAAKNRTAAGTVQYALKISSLQVPQNFAQAAEANAHKPYHGYYFRELQRGQHVWLVGNTLMGGFGLVAWPAQYGVTGIHTFLVNQDGVVYEKDRGAKTGTPITRFDVNSSWTPVD